MCFHGDSKSDQVGSGILIIIIIMLPAFLNFFKNKKKILVVMVLPSLNFKTSLVFFGVSKGLSILLIFAEN